MELIEYTVNKSEEFNEALHYIYFTFEGVKFKAVVAENPNETYVQDAFINRNHPQFENYYQVIDIPNFFGTGFSSYVFNFIYSNIKEVY